MIMIIYSINIHQHYILLTSLNADNENALAFTPLLTENTC